MCSWTHSRCSLMCFKIPFTSTTTDLNRERKMSRWLPPWRRKEFWKTSLKTTLGRGDWHASLVSLQQIENEFKMLQCNFDFRIEISNIHLAIQNMHNYVQRYASGWTLLVVCGIPLFTGWSGVCQFGFCLAPYMQKAGDTWNISPQIFVDFPQNFRLRTRNQYCTQAIAWGSTI